MDSNAGGNASSTAMTISSGMAFASIAEDDDVPPTDIEITDSDDDDRDVPPTDIDITDDDDDDDDVIVVGDPPQPSRPSPSALYAASSTGYWCDRIGSRMEEAVRHVGGTGGRVRWHLPQTLSQDIVEWTIAHINDVLAQQYVRAFYIGMTHKVGPRWTNPVSGHCRKGWHRMYLCAVSDDDGKIARAETSVIEQFRYYGRGGVVLGPRDVAGRTVTGHQLCSNRNPGSEGGFHGIPPHVLYVCWRWNPRSR